MIGQLLGTYRIVEMLGEGGMGVVYRGVDTFLERSVAIKVLSPEYSRNTELLDRFRTEAKAQANLNHPNIATLYAFLAEGDQAWMVMEYVNGETITDMILRRGLLPSSEALPMFKQALAGLGYAHRMGVIHRDIKPSNLMVNREGIVKVMDFGIAKMAGGKSLTRTGTRMGTAFYMSPEQVLNRGVDIRSDIYSLGVTLYEMVTANVPFQAESEFEILTSHVNAPPPLPTTFYPHIPKGVVNAILKALEKDPERRFQTAEQFSTALDQPEDFEWVPALASDSSSAPFVPAAGTVVNTPTVEFVPGAGAPIAAPAPRKPGLLPFLTSVPGVILAVVLLVACAAGGWYALRPKPAPIGAGGNQGMTPPSPGPSNPNSQEIVIPPPAGGTPAEVAGSKNAGRSGGGSSSTGNAGPSGGGTSGAGKGSAPSGEMPGNGVTPSVEPTKVAIIPPGTEILLRTIDSIDTDKNEKGQRVQASVNAPVMIDGQTVVPRGATATLRLVEVKSAGRFRGSPEIQVTMASLTLDGHSRPVSSDTYQVKGGSRGKVTAGVVGGVAAVGAAIGGIFGGGKGAAAGAAAGAGGGTAVQAVHKGKELSIPSEALISFHLAQPLSLK